MASGGEKTEKATPKRREEARQKGQVAKSADFSGAVVMLVGIYALSAAGGAIAERMEDSLRRALVHAGSPSVVDRASIGEVLMPALKDTALAVAPIAIACLVAGVVANVLQVGLKPTPKAIMPDPKRMNPVQGLKNIFAPKTLLVEGSKSIAKVAVVGIIVAAAVVPDLPTLGSLVGMEPQELAASLVDKITGIAQRAVFAYLFIGIVDIAWQRHRHEKGLKMEKQEVKEEMKGMSLPAEVRMAQRRRASQMARARMMTAVPEADVVVTNPTHYSVALKYESGMLAPKVVAKGKDVIAFKIREIAALHGVPVVPNPPLARGLYAAVEVERQIPEEFFAAVASVLAHVYRVAGRAAA
jgi:flagellar biosynthetic protein FlhB